MRPHAPYTFEYARLAVPDMEATRQFFEYHVGLETVDNASERVTLRCAIKHHCIELESDPSLEAGRVLALGYSVESADVLDDMRQRVKNAGYETLPLTSFMQDYSTDGFALIDPNGLRLEFVHEFYEWAEPPLLVYVPEQLVHPFVWTDKYEDTRALYMDVLGWQASDYLGKTTVFLRGEDRHHHSMGLGKTPTFKVAHLCFKMKSFDHVMRGRARAAYKGLRLSPDLVNHSGSGSLAFYIEELQHGPPVELCDGHRVLTPEQHEDHKPRRLFRDPRNVDVWRAASDDDVRGSTSAKTIGAGRA